MKEKTKTKYLYSIKLNVKCENCDYEYKSVDNFVKSNITLDEIDKMYDYSNKYATCKCCGSNMYVDEILGIDRRVKMLHLNNLDLDIDEKNRVVPKNTMKLVGIPIDGVNENNKCEAVILDLSEENFKKLFNRGKDLKNNGYTSKYIICLMQKDKCFSFVRPDQNNFEKYYRLYNFMNYDERLRIYNSDAKFYLIKDSLKSILKHFDVEETYDYVPVLEKEEKFEIS